MTEVPRLLRGTLPSLVALAVMSAFVLPASAEQAVSEAISQPATAARAMAPAAPTRATQWWLTALDVSRAWQSAPQEGSGVTVAVLSTGVDAAHEDLAGSVTTGPVFISSGRKAGGPYWGLEGTAVASLLAGHGHGRDGTDGITGIAPRAHILSVQVTLEYNDPLNSDAAITRQIPDAIAAGIRYAVAHGATVIALPLDPGMFAPAGTIGPAADGSPAEQAAVSYALGHGVVLVAPAGDNGMSTGTVNFPASYPGVIAVGATERDGQLAPFTSKRSYVSLTAPGAGLTVAAPDGGYATLATTDMSAALTAGVAALIRSRFPLLTQAEVAQALEKGAVRRASPHPAPGTGNGALNAAGALAAAAVIAAAHPASAQSAPPAVGAAAAPPSSPRPAAVHPLGLGALAGTLLQKVVIAACALIAALGCALVLAALRRRRAQAARMPLSSPRAGQAGTHARRSRGTPVRQTPGRPSASAWGQPPAFGSASGTARVRIVPASAVGTLGPSGHARRRRTTGNPPWEPASPPKEALPTLPITITRPRAGQHAALAPWEQAPAQFATAPAAADPSEWASTTGPMYVWNPNASGPQPVIEWEEDQDLSERTGPTRGARRASRLTAGTSPAPTRSPRSA